MYAIFSMRKMELTSRINQIQYKLMELSQKLTDIALFGANVQDGVITPDEFINSPAGLFGPMLIFGKQAMGQAVPQADFQMKLYKEYQAKMLNSGTTGQMMPSDQFMYNGFLRQSLESVAKGMQKRIAAEENKIQMQKTRLETQLKAAQAELQSCEGAEQQGLKQATPKYA